VRWSCATRRTAGVAVAWKYAAGFCRSPKSLIIHRRRGSGAGRRLRTSLAMTAERPVIPCRYHAARREWEGQPCKQREFLVQQQHAPEHARDVHRIGTLAVEDRAGRGDHMEGAQQGRGTDNAHQDDVYLKPPDAELPGHQIPRRIGPRNQQKGRDPIINPTDARISTCSGRFGARWHFSAMRSHTSERPAVNDRLSPPIKRSGDHTAIAVFASRFQQISKTRNVECLSASRSGNTIPRQR